MHNLSCNWIKIGRKYYVSILKFTQYTTLVFLQWCLLIHKTNHARKIGITYSGHIIFHNTTTKIERFYHSNLQKQSKKRYFLLGKGCQRLHYFGNSQKSLHKKTSFNKLKFCYSMAFLLLQYCLNWEHNTTSSLDEVIVLEFSRHVHLA